MTPTLVTVVCPTCANHADVHPAAVPTATCHAHDAHRHRRGVAMVAQPQTGTQTAMAGKL